MDNFLMVFKVCYAADRINMPTAYLGVLIPLFIFEHVAFLPYFVFGGFHVSFCSYGISVGI